MLKSVADLPERDKFKFSMFGGKLNLLTLFNYSISFKSIANKIPDSDNLNIKPVPQFFKIGSRAIEPSSFIISTALLPVKSAKLQVRSTTASVWPVFSGHPLFCLQERYVRDGRVGRLVAGSTSALMVIALSFAEKSLR
jgi:hypothetical protein